MNEACRPLTPRLAWQLAAPHTWAASLCPALFGVLFSWYRGWPLGVGKGLALVCACVLLQSAVNTLNDYFDFVKGTDSPQDAVEVSDAALVYGHIDPKSALRLGLGYLAAGAVLGIAGCAHSGPVPWVIGLIGVAVMALYSAGPAPISYLPVGELVSGVTMGGLIPLGIAACADGAPHPGALVWSLPFTAGIALIMMSNNGCDIEKDLRAGRRTLPVLLGRERTLGLYRALTALWLGLLCVQPVLLLGVPGLVCPVLTALLGRGAFGALFRLRLEPGGRVLQMKGIAAANRYGNGAYLAALALALFLEAVHG